MAPAVTKGRRGRAIRARSGYWHQRWRGSARRRRRTSPSSPSPAGADDGIEGDVMGKFTVHLHLEGQPMSAEEIEIAKTLRQCSFLPACWDKRFARELAWIAINMPEFGISDRQRAHLWRLGHRYRRQLPGSINALVAAHAAGGNCSEASSGRRSRRPIPLRAARTPSGLASSSCRAVAGLAGRPIGPGGLRRPPGAVGRAVEGPFETP